MVFKKCGRVIISSLIVGGLFFAFSIQVRAAPSLKMKLDLGFEGQYSIGRWAPLRILLENQGRSLKGNLLIKFTRKDLLEDKYAEITYRLPISLPTSSRKLYQVNVLLESDLYPLKVLLATDEKVLLEREIHLKPFYKRDGFILVVNRTHSGFDFLNPSQDKKVRRVLYAKLDELPDRWIGYDAIQALILDDVASVELTRTQQEAIKLWLSCGGTLVITARGSYGKFKSPFLLSLLPLESLKKVHLSFSFSSLEDRYGPFKETPQDVELWKSRWREGDILIEEKGIPLLVRLKKEQGRIFFLAFDFFQPPFRGWSGTARLWEEMLTEEISHPLFTRGILDPVMSSSFSWQGRLYPGRKEIAFFILIYIFLVGFFSWQMVKGGSFKRWKVGLPLIIILFTSISYLMGAKMRDENTILREVSIFYQRREGSLARTESYLVLFSPCSRVLELKFDEKRSFVSSPLTPLRDRLFNALMVQLERGKLRWKVGLSPPWSFHLFRLETVSPFSFKVRVDGEGKNTRVSLENLNSFSLEDIMLLYGGKSIFLRELPPSGRAELSLKEGREFVPSMYLQEIMLKEPDPEAKLRKEVFERIWEPEGPLREVAVKSGLLLAWFKDFPEAAVRADHKVKFDFSGLLIRPLKGGY